MFQGNSNRILIWRSAEFLFNSSDTKNIRLKWLALCINLDFSSGNTQLFLNGQEMPGRKLGNTSLPVEAATTPLIVRIGKLYTDSTPLIGKIVDINMFDRYLVV